MDTFRDISPDEAKLITLQFLGQNVMSEVKEIDKNIIDRNRNLQGLTIQPQDILNSIPGITRNQQAQQAPQQAPQYIQSQLPHAPAPVLQQPQGDPNQLEFNFDNSATAQKIFDRIDTILRKIEALEKIVTKLSPR
jgi:hypothetical protein